MPQQKKIEKTREVSVRVTLVTQEWHVGTTRVPVPETWTDEQICEFVKKQMDEEAIDVWSVVDWAESETEKIEVKVEDYDAR